MQKLRMMNGKMKKIAAIVLSVCMVGLSMGSFSVSAEETSEGVQTQEQETADQTADQTVEVEAVSLNTTQATLNVGSTVLLSATVLPENATDSGVTWVSNQTSIATVNSTGLVTAATPGTAIIKAVTSNDEVTATCRIVVKQPASSITLNRTSLTLYKYGSYKLIATMLPSNTTDSVKWTTSNSKVVKVSSSGVIKGMYSGTATITATTTSGKTAIATITVKTKTTGLKLSKKTKTLKKGQTYSIAKYLKVYPSDSTDSIKYYSSNTDVATVSSLGVITALDDGKTVITIKSGANTAKFTVKVKKVKATKITVSKKSLTLKSGKKTKLKTKLYPSTSTDSVIWKSSNSKVVKVSKSGTVKAVKKGKATLTAITSSGKKVKTTVKVK